jgi:hypothetical protein
MNVTREVISDLWPVYAAGEASDATRNLVESFLAADPEFARTLRPAATLPHTIVSVPAAAEVKALKRTRDLVHGRSWLRALRLIALAFTGLAVLHAVNNIPTTDEARRALFEGIAAVVCWAAYAVLLRHYRANSLRVGGTGRERP